MALLNKLDFPALSVSGENYVSWTMDVKLHLISRKLIYAIKPNNTLTDDQNADAMILIRRHLDDVLRMDYTSIQNPRVLWDELASRFDHQKTILLPEARNRWTHLRFMDFKTVNEYNSEVCRIKSTLEFCGEKLTEEEILEKTYSTFPASHVILSQQYRAKNYTKFSELITVLLLAEKNFDLLMKNNEARPVGTKPLPEVNVVSKHNRGNESGEGPSHQKRGKWIKGKNGPRKNQWKRNTTRGGSSGQRGGGRNGRHGQWNNNMARSQDQNRNQNQNRDTCHRCGGYGHWSRTCRSKIVKGGAQPREAHVVETNALEIDHTPQFPSLGTSDHMTQSGM